MIHHNPIPVAVSNPDNAVHKKKKRKNKKKKAAKKVVDESSSDSDSDNEDLAFMTASQFHSNAPRGSSKPKPAAVAYHTNQLDDPVTVTIKQVVGKSHYNHDRVATCVNRMWDTGLQYDSPEAVLAELQREDDKKVEEQDDYDEILDGKRRVGINPPVPSLPPPVQVQTSQSSTKPKAAGEQPTFAKPPAIPSISFGRHTISPVPPSQAATSSVSKQEQQRTAPQQVLSLSARLEVIASHDDINQALIALNSWCQMTPNASLSFFQHDCYAIEIILQRFCAVPSLIHESSVRTQLITLLTQLLPPPNLKSSAAPRSDHIHSLINAFSTLLDQVANSLFLSLSNLSSSSSSSSLSPQAARSTSLKIATPLTSSNSNTPSQTSRLSPLALRLGQSLRKTHQTYEKTRATFSQSDSIFVIEDEINSVNEAIHKLQQTTSAAALSSSSVGTATATAMKEKFELRELISEVFQLHLKKLDAIQKQKAKSSLTPIDYHSSPSSISYSQQDNFALENAILLASGDSRRNIDALKLQASSSKNYYEKLFHEHETRMLPYQTDLQKLKTNYSELEMKRARILREISELEEEMAHITSKAETIEMFLKGLQEQHENQINTLNTSHGNIVDALEKDKQLTQLFGNLKELERVMDEVSSVGIATSTATTVATGGAGNGNGNETEVLLETFVSYSEIETKCIEFLAKRVQLMREKILYSQREVTEYQNLGMSNLAAEITLSIERMKENITEDLCALESLQNTVCEMLTSLHSTIRNHSVVRAMPSHCLQEIAANLKSAGVTLRPELAPYNISNAPPPGLHPPVAAASPAPVVAVTVAPRAPEPKPSTAPAAAPAAAKTAKPQSKATTATEKKMNEKQQQQQQQQIGEKKFPPKVNAQPAAAAAAPQTVAPAKDKKPSKESPKANAKSGPAPLPAAAPAVEPLPPRTNSKRKATPTAAAPPVSALVPAPVATPAVAANGTPQKPHAPEKPSVPVTPPPGFSATKRGWAPLPAKPKSGSLAQIQAEQEALAKKARELAQAIAIAPAAAATAVEFPPLKDEVPTSAQVPAHAPQAEQQQVEVESGEEESKATAPAPAPAPVAAAMQDEEDNADARSDISIRGNDDELDDDDLDREEEEKDGKTEKIEEAAAVAPTEEAEADAEEVVTIAAEVGAGAEAETAVESEESSEPSSAPVAINVDDAPTAAAAVAANEEGEREEDSSSNELTDSAAPEAAAEAVPEVAAESAVEAEDDGDDKDTSAAPSVETVVSVEESVEGDAIDSNTKFDY